MGLNIFNLLTVKQLGLRPSPVKMWMDVTEIQFDCNLALASSRNINTGIEMSDSTCLDLAVAKQLEYSREM